MVSFSVGGAQEVIQLPHSEIINLPDGAYPNGTILGDIDNGHSFIISNGLPRYIGETKVFKGKAGYRPGSTSIYFDQGATNMYEIVGECLYPTWIDFNFPVRFYEATSNPRPRFILTAWFIDKEGAVKSVVLLDESRSYTNPEINEVIEVIGGKFRLSDYQPASCFGCVILDFKIGLTAGGSARTLEQDVNSYLKMYSGTVPADVFSVAASRVFEGDEDSGTFSANASFLED